MIRINLPKGQRKILKFIGEQSGKLGYSVYLVGGPVRDLLLGRTSQDIDIVCVGDAIKLAKKFRRKVKGKLIYHHDFPNATVKFRGGKIDFVTARREKYPRGKVGLPKVEKTDDIIVDLKRRDFTFNAIACDLIPTNFCDLIDPFGGLKDCEKRLIRILHPDSFKEDPTRIFRAIRFKMKLEFNLEHDTEKYLKRDLKYLKGLTHDRLWKEIKLCLKDGSSILKFLKDYRVLRVLKLNYPDDNFIERIDIGAVQFGVDYVNTYILALTEKKRPKSLGFDNRLSRQIEYVRKIDNKRLMNVEVVHELFYLEDYSLLYLFGKYPANSIIIENFFDNRGELKCELDGMTIKKMGVKEGPLVGKILNKIIELRWTGKITGKEDEVELVRKYFLGGKNDD
ncbi:CCA tRNA nucleotidyltransferase [candidate division WOR-3 bacterium]|jgi:tRNA nucleotidyltransferase/poly(A) polymerase|nr:CCA tRNA nucleotidyltransferase [candidate division WOR-3 bacterium]